MKSIEEQMSFYQAYHYHPLNKLSHFIGIPLIIFSLLLLLSSLRTTILGFEITSALLFIATVWVYYVFLDLLYALSSLIIIIPLLYFADFYSQNDAMIYIFLLCFIIGWIIQLIGHYYEGRKPALVDNFFQIFIAPLFLIAELYYHFGFRKNQQEMVMKLSERYKK